MQGVVKVDGDSEQKFIEGTLVAVPSPAPTEPQTPMDVDKASIYRYSYFCMCVCEREPEHLFIPKPVFFSFPVLTSLLSDLPETKQKLGNVI